MGNAFGAVARGENAMLYNPAGLAQFFLDFKTEASGSAESQKKVKDIRETLKYLRVCPDSDQMEAYLREQLGKEQEVRSTVFVNSVADLAEWGFGLGIGHFEQSSYRLRFEDRPPTGFDLSDRVNVRREKLRMRIASFALPLFERQLLAGFSYRRLNYFLSEAEQDYRSTILHRKLKPNLPNVEYKGSAYDFGLIYRLQQPRYLRTQLSLVGYNLGATELKGSTNLTEFTTPASFNFGVAMQPYIGPWRLLISLDMEDISKKLLVDLGNGTKERSLAQRMHFGIEMGVKTQSTGNHLFNLRIGSNRGLFTWGVELNLFSVLRIIYTRWQDDLGNKEQKIKRRYNSAGIVVGFEF